MRAQPGLQPTCRAFVASSPACPWMTWLLNTISCKTDDPLCGHPVVAFGRLALAFLRSKNLYKLSACFQIAVEAAPNAAMGAVARTLGSMTARCSAWSSFIQFTDLSFRSSMPSNFRNQPAADCPPFCSSDFSKVSNSLHVRSGSLISVCAMPDRPLLHLAALLLPLSVTVAALVATFAPEPYMVRLLELGVWGGPTLVSF